MSSQTELHQSPSINRREFLNRSFRLAGALTLSGATATFLAACGSKESAVNETHNFQLLDEKSGFAASIGYVNNIKKANKAKYPQWKAENTCNKCLQWQKIAKSDGSAYQTIGRCKVIPETQKADGPVINAGGWCSIFVPAPKSA